MLTGVVDSGGLDETDEIDEIDANVQSLIDGD
jgi:hypothetical protein